MPLSSMFGYINFNSEDTSEELSLKRRILFEFVVIKNIIFNGLFFKAEEVFTSLNLNHSILKYVVVMFVTLAFP